MCTRLAITHISLSNPHADHLNHCSFLHHPNLSLIAQVLNNASTATYTLSIVRLAPPEHSYMAELNATVKGAVFSLCSDAPSAEPMPELNEAGEPIEGTNPPSVGSCVTEGIMWLNVSHDTETVMLHPRLLFPDVQVRLQMKGQG